VSERWQETALLFFLSVGFSRWQKNKCAVCALAFLVQMFNFSTISALLTTGYMFIKIHVYLNKLLDKRMFLSILFSRFS
jgi:hypothetical protein